MSGGGFGDRDLNAGHEARICLRRQTALREWAYGWTYQKWAHRTDALASWHHHYSWHRPHSGIGGLAPMSRLNSSRNNLLTLHT